MNGNCPEAGKNHDTAILKKLELTAWILTCKNRNPTPAQQLQFAPSSLGGLSAPLARPPSILSSVPKTSHPPGAQ